MEWKNFIILIAFTGRALQLHLMFRNRVTVAEGWILCVYFLSRCGLGFVLELSFPIINSSTVGRILIRIIV